MSARVAVPTKSKQLVHIFLAAFLAGSLCGANVIADTPQAHVYEKSPNTVGKDHRPSDLKDYNIFMNGEGMTIVLYDGYRLELRKGQCAKIRAVNVRVIPPEEQGPQNQSTGGLRYHKYTYPNATSKGGLSRPRSSRHH